MKILARMSAATCGIADEAPDVAPLVGATVAHPEAIHQIVKQHGLCEVIQNGVRRVEFLS
jgi:hypothetical protein